MANKILTTQYMVDKYIESVCAEAIKHAMQRYTAELRKYINVDYYKQYEPIWYDRTEQFLKSAVYTLLSPTEAEVGMDYSMMDYGAYWDGETQVEFASRGYHGTTTIQTEGRFWDDFVDWMNKNAIEILRFELEKQFNK